MTQPSREQRLEVLAPLVTDHKKELMTQVLSQRTRHITLLLEEIFQPHNASAALRSCDCFGIQDIHVLEARNRYSPSKEVDMGSSKWLTLHRYKTDIDDAVSTLKNRGYTIVATTPHADGFTPETLPLDKPIALAFGTELAGLSDRAIELADSYLTIPMYGFTESFNISVSVAIILNRLVERMRASNEIEWHLSDEEKQNLTLEWYKKIIKRSDQIEKVMFSR
ncbi:RNA methyltransferase [bacterium]|nr:RNA methyltransferase [bacterium]